MFKSNFTVAFKKKFTPEFSNSGGGGGGVVGSALFMTDVSGATGDPTSVGYFPTFTDSAGAYLTPSVSWQGENVSGVLVLKASAIKQVWVSFSTSDLPGTTATAIFDGTEYTLTVNNSGNQKRLEILDNALYDYLTARKEVIVYFDILS